MNCSLWFGRCRVNNASEIAEHFDLASVRGYFLGGSLAEWLREHGGEQQAAELDALDPKDPALDRRLAEIFGQAPKAQKKVFTGTAAAGCCSGGAGYGSGSSFRGSYFPGSFSLTSFLGNFGYGSGSFFSGSYSVGSYGGFRMREWEWEWRYSSFLGSFGGGSRRAGSFFAGMFIGGSFYGSFRTGSFLGGSFPCSGMGYGSRFITPDEYDRIMYETLRRCPLDCFGYGIHIV